MSSSGSENSDIREQRDEQSEPLSSAEGTNGNSLTPRTHYARVILLIAAVVVALEGGELLIVNPLIRMFEAILCRKHYDNNDPSVIGRDGWVPEQLCKIEPVESGVALLLGWQTFFDYLPSLLLAIPYGWLADKYGRRGIIIVSLVSYWIRSALIMVICYFWQTLPLKLTWATSIHAVFGGGTPVASALALTMVSDMAPEEQRASILLRLTAASLLVNFISPPISAVLMERSLWIPMLLGLSISLLAIPFAIAIPETIHHSTTSEVPEAGPLLPSDTTDEARITTNSPRYHRFNLAKDSVGFIFRDWRVPPLIMTFFVPAATPFTTLYLSKRYKRSIADATLLVSIRAGVSIFVFLLFVPALSNILLRRFAFTSLTKDLWLARVSCVLSLVGFVLFAFAPNIGLSIFAMIIYTFGHGYVHLIRSFMTGLVEQHHIARLYTVVGIVTTLGSMIASPVLAALFQEGLQLGGLWVGLPYFLISGLFVCITFIMFVVGAKERHKVRSDPSESQDEEVQLSGEEDM
ncbi:MAG: hypothetical protein M1822_008595 [Bathelium mastoideum]|nr:MAG: hypothetical protein M1822_008595 [Bathelium mastoideum]